jgi:hypothetical protein
VHYTVIDPDTNGVEFQSPAGGETSLSHTFGANLASGHLDDRCTGEHSMTAKVKVEVSRDNVDTVATATAQSESWFIGGISKFCQPDPVG